MQDMMRTYIFSFAAVLLLFFSCKKEKEKYQCKISSYSLFPVLSELKTSSMTGLDTIFFNRYDSSMAGFVFRDTITKDDIWLLGDSILSPQAGRQKNYSIVFWSSATYQIFIPGRGRSWLISDVSSEPNVSLYYESDKPCSVPKGGYQFEPKNFKVNGVLQESRIIDLDR